MGWIDSDWMYGARSWLRGLLAVGAATALLLSSACSAPPEGLMLTLASDRDVGPRPMDLGPPAAPVDMGTPPPVGDMGTPTSDALVVEVVGPLQTDNDPRNEPFGRPIPDAQVYLERDGRVASARTDDAGLARLPLDSSGRDAVQNLVVLAASHVPYAAFGVSNDRWVVRLVPQAWLTRPIVQAPIQVAADTSRGLESLGPPNTFRTLTLRAFDPDLGELWPFASRGERSDLEGLPPDGIFRFRDTAFDAPSPGRSDPQVEFRLHPQHPVQLVALGNDRSNDRSVSDPDPDAIALLTLPDLAMAASDWPGWTPLDREVPVQLTPLASVPPGSWALRKIWYPAPQVRVPIGERVPEGPSASLPRRLDLRFPSEASPGRSMVHVATTWREGSGRSVTREFAVPIPPESDSDRVVAPEALLADVPRTAQVRGGRLFVSLDPRADAHRLELPGPGLGLSEGWSLVVTADGLANSYAVPDIGGSLRELPASGGIQISSVRAPGLAPTEALDRTAWIPGPSERVTSWQTLLEP